MAVVQLTSFLVRALKTYYCGTCDARDDITRLFSAVSSLGLLLNQIEGLPNNGYTTGHLDLLKDPLGPLRLIKVELESVKLAIASPNKAMARLGSLVQTLKWLLRSDDLMKTVEVIERHKVTLNSHVWFGMMRVFCGLLRDKKLRR